MPQLLLEGRYALTRANVLSMLEQMRVKRPLLVAGRHMSEVFAERVGQDVPVWSGYHANPDLADCRGGVRLYEKEGCDGLISLGGGSAMDTAKGIAALAGADYEAVRRSDLPETGLPHLAIPTTAGTGAEATSTAVLYEEGRKLSVDHPSLLPGGIVLDGSLLDSLPGEHRRACAMDALCQGIESWWSRRATMASRKNAEASIRQVLAALPAYLDGDRDAQDAMLHGAYLSGVAIRATRTTAAHAMSYQITKRLGYAHGHACMLTLPHLWAHLARDPAQAPMLRELSVILGTEDGPKCLQGLLLDLGMTVETMPEEATLDALVSSVNPERLGNHPEALTQDDLRAIYRAAFSPAADKAACLRAWRERHG